MNVSIDKVENLRDGRRIRVTLSGTPSVPIRFLIGQTPDPNRSFPVDAVFVRDEHPVYTITMPSPSGWHIWAQEGAEATKRPGAVWVSVSDRQELDELGDALTQILLDNFDLLDAALSQRGVDARMKQCIYGYGGLGDEFPVIIINRPSYTRESFFAPQGWLYRPAFPIQCFILHNETATEISAAGTLTNAITKILSIPAYQDIVLPSGVTVTGAGIHEASVEESELDIAGFEVLCSLQWRGEYQIQEFTS